MQEIFVVYAHNRYLCTAKQKERITIMITTIMVLAVVIATVANAIHVNNNMELGK